MVSFICIPFIRILLKVCHTVVPLCVILLLLYGDVYMILRILGLVSIMVYNRSYTSLSLKINDNHPYDLLYR